jgi:hypothetical protein
MVYRGRLESWINVAERGWRAEDPQPLLEEIKSPTNTSTDIGGDIEIVFREMLDRLLKMNQVSATPSASFYQP